MNRPPMIVYRKFGLRIGDVFFDDQEWGEPVDILRCHERSSPLPGFDCSPFYTILIDLTKPEAVLLGEVKKGTRYEIRRAEGRDQLTQRMWYPCSSEVLLRFCRFYDRFAEGKGLSKSNKARLLSLSNASLLCLSSVDGSDGTELVWHAYVRTPERPRLLHSASLFRESGDAAHRQLVGRANRYLHWQDLLRFKGEGIPCLDMGGWYEGTGDAERLRINEFKQEFGGEIVKTFNCRAGRTMIGRLVLRILKSLKRAG